MTARIATIALVIIAVLSQSGFAISIARAGVALDEAGKFTLFTDFRLRLESDWDSQQANGTHRSDRTRLRTRVRAELRYKPISELELGARVRTGSRDSQQSPHITLHDFTSETKGDRQVVFDKWYGKVQHSAIQAWAGRNSFPFWTQNEMFWDDDVTPAGVAGGFGFSAAGGELQFNAGYFALPDGMTEFNGQLGGGQIVYTKEFGDVVVTAAGGAYLFDGDSGSKNLRNGNGDRDYTIWVGSLQFKTMFFGQPVTLGLDGMHNSEDYSKNDSDAFTAANHDETDGFVVSAIVGNLNQRGNWMAAYYYAEVETFAVNASYAQDDWVRFGSATQTDSSDIKGHEFQFGYSIRDNINMLARLFLVEAITNSQDGKRFRLDLNIKF